MMMIKNSAVMIPVMLYRMIIATAVVGDFARVPPEFCPVPLVEFKWMLVTGKGGFALFKPSTTTPDELASTIVYKIGNEKSWVGVNLHMVAYML